MKIKVYDIEYDISREDVEDTVDYILEAEDLLEANQDFTEIDIDMDITDDTDDEILTIIFADSDLFDTIDDDTVYYYNITEVNEAESKMHGKLIDKQSVEGFALDIAADLPEFMVFNVDEASIDHFKDLNEIIADLISNETDYLVQSFDYEIME